MVGSRVRVGVGGRVAVAVGVAAAVKDSAWSRFSLKVRLPTSEFAMAVLVSCPGGEPLSDGRTGGEALDTWQPVNITPISARQTQPLRWGGGIANGARTRHSFPSGIASSRGGPCISAGVCGGVGVFARLSVRIIP